MNWGLPACSEAESAYQRVMVVDQDQDAMVEPDTSLGWREEAGNQEVEKMRQVEGSLGGKEEERSPVGKGETLQEEVAHWGRGWGEKAASLPVAASRLRLLVSGVEEISKED